MATLLGLTVGCGGSSTAPGPVAVVVATPSISIPSGTYASTQLVSLSDSTVGSTIHYTTDGTVPTSSSAIYQQSISVAVTSTIQAIAFLNGTPSAVASSILTISRPPQAATLTFLQQPTSALVGASLSPAVQVGILDNTGTIDKGATNPVTLALVGGTGLTGTLTATAQNGIATFGDLSISNAGTGYMLAAASAGLVSATSASFTITAPIVVPVAVKLAFSQQPSDAVTTAVISPAMTVIVQDANGNAVTAASNPVTLALVNGAGLAGTLTVVPVNGIATFSNITVSAAGTYTISATSAGLVAATSAPFNIRAPINNGTTINQSMPVSITAFSAGTFEITYNWLAVPVTTASTVFVDFVDNAGTIQFQDNVQPATSTSQWTGAVSYTHTVTVPSTATAGKYSIVAGIESPNGNISLVTGSGVATLSNARYQIGTLIIAPTCSISSFGAVGDGKTDNAAAIQATLDSAATTHCIALIPTGNYAYSGTLNATGIAVAGTGSASVLMPLSLTNEALILGGSGGSISNLVMVSTATARLLSQQSGMIWVQNADNYYIENVLINDSSSTGILSENSHDGFILNNTIEHTRADSITQVYGSYNIAIIGNRIVNSGDDGISNNSYVGDPGVVHAITVRGNTIQANTNGRGLEVSGGSDLTFTGNFVDNLDGFTDMYIASESEFNTQGVANVTVSGNTFLDGGPNQGSAIIYNSQAGATTITGVAINGNQFVNPKLTALQYAGNGIETQISIDSNTDYSNNQFSTNSNPNANATETGNQVLAPSAYTTPLVPAGGGCNFTGC